jgi:integrase
MGRKPNWPPRVHAHRASGQDRCRYRGEEFYLGPSGSPEARRAYVELIERLAARDAPRARDRLTIGCVVALWRVHAIKQYGPESQEVTEHDYVLAEALALFAALPAEEFDVDHLEQLRDALVASRLARTVVNRRIIRFRTFWRWAERKKHVPKGSWANLRTLPPLRRGEGGVKETRKVKPAEWLTVAAVCRRVNLSVRGLLLAQWFTGARPGELFRLRVGDLVRDGDLAVYRPEKHKTAWRGHERAVFFGPRALRVIAPNLAGKAEGDLIFPNRDDAPYDRRSYGLAISRAARKAGVKLHSYQLRHAFRRRVGRELGLEATRAAMGHASVETTAQYASGVDGKLAADVARRLG